MKTKIIPVIIIMSMLLIPNVLAINTKVNTLPDRSFVYWLTVSMPEKIEMFFTFNQESKLVKRTILSEKRLEEVQKLNQANAPIEDQQKAVNRYSGELEKVEEMVKRGIISSEEARKIIENNLNRIKQREKEVPSDLVPLPIVIDEGKEKPKIDEIVDSIFCPMIYAPVCGNDGKTYPSKCVAQQRGVTIDKDRECGDEEIEEETGVECKEDISCQSNARSCYSKCIDGACVEILTFVKLSDYPNCEEDIKPSPIPNPKPSPSPEQPPREKPTPVPLPIVIETCNSNQECVNRLGSCNAKCIDRECTIVNTFAPTGKYPDCEQRYGVL